MVVGIAGPRRGAAPPRRHRAAHEPAPRPLTAADDPGPRPARGTGSRRRAARVRAGGPAARRPGDHLARSGRGRSLRDQPRDHAAGEPRVDLDDYGVRPSAIRSSTCAGPVPSPTARTAARATAAIARRGGGHGAAGKSCPVSTK